MKLTPIITDKNILTIKVTTTANTMCIDRQTVYRSVCELRQEVTSSSSIGHTKGY